MHALEELNWQKICLGVTEHSSVLINGMLANIWRPLKTTGCMRRSLLEEEVVC
jgi:hypothetical protein